MPIKDEVDLSNEEKHEEQLKLLKQQVKAIMEEAVTKKFIHEESPHVLRLCGTVEKCFLDGLKKRSNVFVRTKKLASLYSKVGQNLPAVAKLIPLIEEAEAKLDKQPPSPEDNRSTSKLHHSVTSGNNSRKYLWVRMAVIAKVLDKMADFLVQNHKKFYDHSSIMSDPVRGKILSSLLVGPCALDYTKVKTSDHYWSDPPADELLQRHKLHSRAYPNSPVKRPTLNFSSNRLSSTSDSMDRGSGLRDYVESLHQNSKISLLYGKNNVTVQPDEVGPIPGYLSLHQEGFRLMIKWIPNQLMNGHDSQAKSLLSENYAIHENGVATNEDSAEESDDARHSRRNLRRRISLQKNRSRSFYWEFTISVDVQDIVYLHCHQSNNNDGVLVLVGQDGVQWPPIRFPPGGHLLTFITCLETALLPHGCLEPPLRSDKVKGRVFPRLRRKTDDSNDNSKTSDFVFRLTTRTNNSDALNQNGDSLVPRSDHSSEFHLMNSISSLPRLFHKSFARKSSVSVSNDKTNGNHLSVKRTSSAPHSNGSTPSKLGSHYLVDKTPRVTRFFSLNIDSEKGAASGNVQSSDRFVPNTDTYAHNRNQPLLYNQPHALSRYANNSSGSSLKMLCNSMRRQIISRAFYGWLAHCRHIASVRRYLTALVNKQLASSDWPTDASVGVTDEVWGKLFQNGRLTDYSELCRHVYFGGIQSKKLRPFIWLFLLGFYDPESDEDERSQTVEESREYYKKIRAVDEDIKLKFSGKSSSSNDVSVTSANDFSSQTDLIPAQRFFLQHRRSISNDVFEPDPFSNHVLHLEILDEKSPIDEGSREDTDLNFAANFSAVMNSPCKRCSSFDEALENNITSGILTGARLRSLSFDEGLKKFQLQDENNGIDKDEISSKDNDRSTVSSHDDAMEYQNLELEKEQKSRSSTLRSESSDLISLNLTQIEKDVFRCDRNHEYFSKQENLDKLSNIMSCYVWEHPDPGYVQGMCDLAAPLLVLFDDESLVYCCFVKLMNRITFQKGNGMDIRLANLRSLTQVLDYELYEYLQRTTDSTHFFFCYRWFLLEFKRELSYDEDVYAVWECSWAARTCCTDDFGLFFALAMLQNYREIIFENDLDFSGIVKFFNEMAEKHDANLLMRMARKLIAEVQQSDPEAHTTS